MNRFVSAPIELFQSLGSTSNRCIAAIAYVTKDWLNLGDEDLLICDASDAAICTRRTDRILLRSLVEKGVQISTSEAAYWFFKGTKQLSSKARNATEKLKTRWESTVDEITADEYEEVPEDLDPLDFHTLQQSEERWRKHLSVGDKIFWCYEDSDWGWIVLPPRTIVSKREYGTSVLAGTEGRYWDFENSIYREQFRRPCRCLQTQI